MRKNFNPRPPRGERRLRHQITAPGLVFQSTPSARRATVRDQLLRRGVEISIHALREESDCCPSNALLKTVLFQSTPSARRATLADSVPWRGWYHFNPRPPRGERPPTRRSPSRRRMYFNPRPPRGERRDRVRRVAAYRQYFNPRPPRGERPFPAATATSGINFNPRPPRGERHRQRRKGHRGACISIHALREESDEALDAVELLFDISIHALREESDKIYV